jgi:hypothetical protein
MGNFLKGPAVASPASIPSGGTTTVTVDLESDDGGDLTITPTAGFEITPPATPVAPGASSASFGVTVKRLTSPLRNCDLQLRFFASSAISPVEIT